MKLNKKSGAILAASAAAFLISGVVLAPAPASAASVKCFGVNGCKGKGACKTASNGCKGHNACKGRGYIKVSAGKCRTLGGTAR